MDRSLRKYRRADWNGRRQRWSQEQLCFAERGQSYESCFGQLEYEEEHRRYGDAGIGGYNGCEDGVTDGYNGYKGEVTDRYAGYEGRVTGEYAGYEDEVTGGYNSYENEVTGGYAGYEDGVTGGYNSYENEVTGRYAGYEDGVTGGYNGYEDRRGAFSYESQACGAGGNCDNQEYSGYFEESSAYADHGSGIAASDCSKPGYLRYTENGRYNDHVPKSKSKANSSYEAGSDYEASGIGNHFVSNSNNRKKSNNKNTSQKSHSPRKKAVSRHQVNRKKSSKMMALAMKRRTRRKKIQKFMVAMLVVFAFCSGFFGRTLFDAYAKEENGNTPIPYYTSIQLAPGDNLWNIASRYAEENGYTIAEYVEELKRMNGLTDGHVHSGEYLTIVYFPE